MRAAKSPGFTLIEILVVASILALTLGASIASYSNFNKTQKVKQGALTFKNNLRLAQAKSLSAAKPEYITDCTQLLGYQVAYVTLNSYRMRASCLDITGATVYSNPATSFVLPSNVEFSAPFTILFMPLTQGVTGAATISLKYTGTTTTYSVRVDSIGDIIDIGFN